MELKSKIDDVELLTNPNLIMVQSKLFSSAFAGPGKWVIYNPENRRSFLATGKDILPEIVPLLVSGTNNEINIPDKIQNKFLEAGLVKAENGNNHAQNYLELFQTALLEYPATNYYEKNWRKNDHDLMASYARMWEQPSKITQRYGNKIPLPEVSKTDLIYKNDKALTLKTISAILKYTFGPIGKIAGQFGPNLRKTSPSGGAKHPTECVIFFPVDFENVSSGYYVYDVETHALIREDYLAENLRMMNEDSIGFVIRTRVERPMWRYRDIRSFRAIFIDAGHVLENMIQLFDLHGYASSIEHPLLKEDEEFSWLMEPELSTLIIQPKNNLKSNPIMHRPSYDFARYSNKHFLTNPSMYFSFEQGNLMANILWPEKQKIKISYEEFNILTHCLPSKRGDRKTNTGGIIEQVENTVPANVTKLHNSYCLLPKGIAKKLYQSLDLWVKHSWYLSFLAHLEVRSSLNDITPVRYNGERILENKNLNLLFNRGTTRYFSEKPIAETDWQEILKKGIAGSFIHTNRKIRVFVAAQNLENISKGLYEFDLNRGELVNTGRDLTNDEIREMTIGMEFAGTGALSIWIWQGMDLKKPGKFELDLMALGQLGQRISMICSRLDLGVFLTPATTDNLTFKKLNLERNKESVFYYFNIGKKPDKKV